jgi:hypothetical protein
VQNLRLFREVASQPSKPPATNIAAVTSVVSVRIFVSPFYRAASRARHFGRMKFTWKRTNQLPMLSGRSMCSGQNAALLAAGELPPPCGGCHFRVGHWQHRGCSSLPSSDQS